MKGNVYFDDQPVCDDDWGHEEAKVACRRVFFFPPRIPIRWPKRLFRIVTPGQFHTLSMCSSECWDTTMVSLKSSQLMVQQREEKGSGGRIFNAGETRRPWKTAKARRTQAVREEKLQELHVTWEV